MVKAINLYDKKNQNLPIIDVMNASKKYSEKEEKWLRDAVNCEFMNLEEPGLSIKFTYGSTKNKASFTLMHGGVYTVPRFIQRHIETKSTPIWKWRPNGEGGMAKENIGSNPRFAMREVYE